MVLNVILAGLAVLSLFLLLWQWLVARRFPLHRRLDALGFSPGITLLKPLKGCDSATESCLRSWFTQDYPGPTQILLGVASADDPVCAVVRCLIEEFPKQDAQLIVCGPLLGANLKVSKLAQLEPLAKYDVLLISDADVVAPSDLLTNVLAHFGPEASGKSEIRNPKSETNPNALMAEIQNGRASGGLKNSNISNSNLFRISDFGFRISDRPLGLVTCFYRLANPTTLAMHWEAVAINADFWSQVLQAQSLKPLDFALGAVMVVRRQPLREIGGFAWLADCLADDYQLGHRLAERGYGIALCPVVVECWCEPMGWRGVWKHQLRWARTIRVCQPAPYFFSILSNPTLWPLLWLAFKPSLPSLAFALVACTLRMLTAHDLQRRLAREPCEAVSRFTFHVSRFTLPLLKDLLQTGLWLAAFLGNRIEWRGERMRLRPDGTLARE